MLSKKYKVMFKISSILMYLVSAFIFICGLALSEEGTGFFVGAFLFAVLQALCPVSISLNKKSVLKVSNIKKKVFSLISIIFMSLISVIFLYMCVLLIIQNGNEFLFAFFLALCIEAFGAVSVYLSLKEGKKAITGKICLFCKNEVLENDKCSHCGNLLYFSSAALFYAENVNNVKKIDLILTDKYLLMKKYKPSKLSAIITVLIGGGLLGAGLFNALDYKRQLKNIVFSEDIKRKNKNIGFYDLRDIKYVLHPYPLKGRNAQYVFRFVNYDDSDFVVAPLSKAGSEKLTDALKKTGVHFQDTSFQSPNETACQHSCINNKNFDKHVANSAGSFVKLSNEQFVVPAIKGSPIEKIDNKYSCY